MTAKTKNETRAPERVAYTLHEFAAIFGRKYHWAYRLAEKGRIKTIVGYGDRLVPATEVERILAEEKAKG